MTATYNIYQRETLDQQPVQIATGLTSKEYSIPGLTKGQKYLISVGAEKNGYEKISTEQVFLAGVEWTPTNLANGVKLWLSSDSVIADSSNRVSQLTDKSGSGFHFTQSTNANKPLISADGLRLDGVDDNLTNMNANRMMNSKSKFYFFMIVRKNALDTAITDNYFYGIPANNSRLRVGLRVGDNGGLSTVNLLSLSLRAADTDSVFRIPVVDMQANIDYMALVQVDLIAKNAQVVLNGVSTSVALTGLSNAFSNVYNTTLPAMAGGAAWSASGYANATLKELIVNTDSLLTQTEINMLFGWSAHKYGLTDVLPNDHPYKTLVPTL
jgi:hypothetical protein